jgi:hypothetical protein
MSIDLELFMPELCEAPTGCPRHVEPGTDYCLIHQHYAEGGENQNELEGGLRRLRIL